MYALYLELHFCWKKPIKIGLPIPEIHKSIKLNYIIYFISKLILASHIMTNSWEV